MNMVTGQHARRFFLALVVVVSLGTAPAAKGEVSSEILDIAARIEFGFYSEDARAIETARSALQLLGQPTRMSTYYDALAAYRLAQLAWASGQRSAGVWLDDCEDSARAAEQIDRRFTEAQIVQAACAALAARAEPLMGIMQQRKAEKILERVARDDPDNPRLALIRSLMVNVRPGLEIEAVAQVRIELHRALEGFRRFDVEIGEPDWGEAEVLAHLGESYLSAGDQRRARDLVEEALIVAPDYGFAQRLMNQVSSQH